MVSPYLSLDMLQRHPSKLIVLFRFFFTLLLFLFFSVNEWGLPSAHSGPTTSRAQDTNSPQYMRSPSILICLSTVSRLQSRCTHM